MSRIIQQNIETIDDVVKFARYLRNGLQLNFHPDNDFSDYINLATRQPLFNPDEVSVLNQMMERCWQVCQECGESIYEIMDV